MTSITTQMRPRLYVVNSGPVLRLSPELATELGLIESVILLQVDYLVSIYGAEGEDGRLWAALSIRDLQRLCFPFWSIATISRTLSGLIENKYLLSNGAPSGQTLAYALGDGCADLRTVRLIGDYSNTVPPVYENAFGKARAHFSKPEPKTPKKAPSITINVYQAAQALATVCQMEFETNKPRLLKEARTLNHEPGDILRLFGTGGAWYRSDFRGQRGSPATPSQVRENWMKMERVSPRTATVVEVPKDEFNV